MEDPGVDLGNEADASSMALAAAEAAAAAEEQEQLVSESQHQEQESQQQEGQEQPEIQQPKESSQEEQNNSCNQPPLESDNHQQEIRTNDNPPPQPNIVENESPKLKCRICGKGPEDDGRILLRFLPTQVDVNTATIAPGVVTFGQDISLHVFCGKTASILPNVNQPDLEILSKAGIKNKHGIGPEVNGALARTRSSTLQAQGTKEKTFYIVKEFEAHLATIRSVSMGTTVVASDHNRLAPPPQAQYHVPTVPLEHAGVAPHTIEPSMDMYHPAPTPTATHGMPTASSIAAEAMVRNPSLGACKIVPHKAGQTFQKHQLHAQRDPWTLAPPDVTITSEGKIRCGCGGTHLPTGTAKGDASWRSHVMTKRHQKWMEENGLLGAV